LAQGRDANTGESLVKFNISTYGTN